ncbi:MAG: HyaD/HybD family hydrogenase maturation endopeptidase [Betaproteobacteria bacterium]|nr:HyaD/HybD family hydrogenase maturation endopeptidase [Betaproteobacteria bacterium]
METSPAPILVLGVGNLLWADEGFGVRAVEALNQGFAFPGHVTLMDGGTQGLYLLPYVEAARKLILFDAVDYRLAPGTLKVVENDDVPAFLGAHKMSLHQVGFQEVLALASLKGTAPEEMVLIGVQPVELEDYGGSLREAVKAQIRPAVEIALDHLRRWGVAFEPRQSAPAAGERLNPCGVELAAYETLRPGPEAACRVGDDRFLNQRVEKENI